MFTSMPRSLRAPALSAAAVLSAVVLAACGSSASSSPSPGGGSAHEPDAYADGLTKAEASKRIDALKEKLGLAD